MRAAPNTSARTRAPLENRPDPVQTAPMTHHAFAFAGSVLHALPSGALYWPHRRLLVVSDLHFGKSERLARRGGSLLPPYEIRATLARLGADLAATQASSVICLGDSFDDTTASGAIDEHERLWLSRLIAGQDWTWISGNHDTSVLDFAGHQRAEVCLPTVAFRHIATPNTPEISGHFHPKARLAGKAQPCFLIDDRRVIMPAYGTYTGGLACSDPVLTGLMKPQAIAVLTGTTARAIPMPRSQIKPRPASFSR